MTIEAIDRYGVMGYPVSHSRSPVIHRLFALQTGQELQYELLQVAPDKLETAVLQFRQAAFLSSKKRMVCGGRSTMLAAKCKNRPRDWKAD